MDVFDLQAVMRFDDSEVKTGLSETGSKLKTFAGGVGTAVKTAAKVGAAAAAAVTATVGGIVKATSETSKYGDEIDKMSQKVGMSTKAYQEWDYVLKISGTEMSAMTTGLKTLTNKFDDAVNGGQTSIDTFARLGLSMEQIEGLSREDLFGEVITAFQGMEDSAERAALANDLFGRSGQELAPLFNTTAEETQKLISDVNELGGVMSEDAVKSSAAFQDSLTSLKTAFGGVTRGLSSEFLPSITKVMDGISAIISGKDGGIDVLAEGISGFIDGISKSLPKIADTAARILPVIVSVITENLPMILDSAAEILTALCNGIIDNLPMILEAAGAVIMKLVDAIIELLPEIIKAGMEILVELAFGIAEALPELIPTIVEVVLQIAETLIDNVDLLIDAALQLIIGLANGLINALPVLIEKAPIIIEKVVVALVNNAPKLLKAALELIVTLANGIVNNLPKVVEAALKIVEKIAGVLKELPKKALEWGKDVIKGLIDGIKSMIGNVGEAVKGVANKIKNFLHFSRPDEGPLRDYEKWMPDFMNGLANGIMKSRQKVADAVQSVADSMQFSDVTVGVNAVGRSYGQRAISYAGATININISGDTNNPRRLAERLSQELATLTSDNQSRMGAWAL